MARRGARSRGGACSRAGRAHLGAGEGGRRGGLTTGGQASGQDADRSPGPGDRLVFVFLDGVGLAPAGEDNPFSLARTPWLDGQLAGGLVRGAVPVGEAVLAELDATMGWPGLPQSATGQTALLTGGDACGEMGGHYGPWPGPTLKRLLDSGTLFSEVLSAGREALLANAYPPGYFSALESRRARVNVPVHAALAAGLELPRLDAYGRGDAVAADLTGEYFAALDESSRPLTPRESGIRLARLTRRYDFVFFDFWLSDRTGHRGTASEALSLVEKLDDFLWGVADGLGTATLLVTSDHGNLEELAGRRHTRNPVPLLALGPAACEFPGCRTLRDVAPAARRALGLPPLETTTAAG